MILNSVMAIMSCYGANGVPAEPKREMPLCRRMRVTRSSGLGYKLAVSWLQPKGGIGRHMQYVQIVD